MKMEIKKYVCPNCGTIDEILIQEENTYEWEDNVVGKQGSYMRTLANGKTLKVMCSICKTVLKNENRN